MCNPSYQVSFADRIDAVREGPAQRPQSQGEVQQIGFG